MRRDVLTALACALAACSDYRPGPLATDAAAPPRDAPHDGGGLTPAPGTAGSACVGGVCEAPLACDPFGVGGFCTRSMCADRPSQDDERAACGGAARATCLSQGTAAGAEAYCTNACEPAARTEAEGGCREGMVCTGWWYTRDDGPDRTGCFPFCERDEHCASVAPFTRCHVRAHLCAGTGVDPSLLPDGEPCDPTRVAMTPSDPFPRNRQCRGFCLAVVPTDRARGICATRVNLRVTTTCPDYPGAMLPFGREGVDNLAVCVFKPCATDADCASPLRCLASSATASGRACNYPAR